MAKRMRRNRRFVRNKKRKVTRRPRKKRKISFAVRKIGTKRARIGIGNKATSVAATRAAGGGSSKSGDRFPISEGRFKGVLSRTSIGILNNQKGGTGLPMLMGVRQSWHKDTYALGNGSLAVQEQVFRMNSTFQCSVTNAGQPKGRDLTASLYTTYTVLKCKYTITVRNNHTKPARLHTVVNLNSAHGMTGVDELQEENTVTTLVLSASDENDGNEIGVLTGMVDMSNYMKPVTGNYRDNHLSLIESNPPTVVFLHVMGTGDLNADIPDTGALTFAITLQYYVVYSSHTGLDQQS